MGYRSVIGIDWIDRIRFYNVCGKGVFRKEV